MRKEIPHRILPSLLVNEGSEEAKTTNQRIRQYLQQIGLANLIDILESYNRHFYLNVNYNHLLEILRTRREQNQTDEIQRLILFYDREKINSSKIVVFEDFTPKNAKHRNSITELESAEGILNNIEKIVNQMEDIIQDDLKPRRSFWRKEKIIPSSVLVKRQKILTIAIKAEKERIQNLRLSKILNMPEWVDEKWSIPQVPSDERGQIDNFYRLWRSLSNNSLIKQKLIAELKISIPEINQLAKTNYGLDSFWRQGTAQRRYFAFRWCYFSAQQLKIPNLNLKQLRELQVQIQNEIVHATHKVKLLKNWKHKEAKEFHKQYSIYLNQFQKQILNRWVDLWLWQWEHGLAEQLQDPDLYQGLSQPLIDSFHSLLKQKARFNCPQKIQESLTPLVRMGFINTFQLKQRLFTYAEHAVIPEVIREIDNWLDLQNHPWFTFLEQHPSSHYMNFKDKLKNNYHEEMIEFHHAIDNGNYIKVEKELQNWCEKVVPEKIVYKNHMNMILNTVLRCGYGLVKNVTQQKQDPITTLQPFQHVSQLSCDLANKYTYDKLSNLNDLQRLIVNRQQLIFVYSDFHQSLINILELSRKPKTKPSEMIKKALSHLTLILLEHKLFSTDECNTLLIQIQIMQNKIQDEQLSLVLSTLIQCLTADDKASLTKEICLLRQVISQQSLTKSLLWKKMQATILHGDSTLNSIKSLLRCSVQCLNGCKKMLNSSKRQTFLSNLAMLLSQLKSFMPRIVESDTCLTHYISFSQQLKDFLGQFHELEKVGLIGRLFADYEELEIAFKTGSKTKNRNT